MPSVLPAVKPPDRLAHDLAAAIVPHRDQIVERWARALHEMAGTSYQTRSLAELRQTAGAWLDAYLAVLERGQLRDLRAFTSDLAELRVGQGFRLSEVLRAFAEFRQAAQPELGDYWADDPVGLLAATERLQAVSELASFDFADAYVQAALAESEQYARRLRELNARLADESTHDDLTGLYDRGFFEVVLTREVRRAQHYHHSLAVVIADIDHFKQFNDTYGHQQGDRALRHVAELLAAAARSTDYVCRYGGEEFAMLLPETSLVQALAMAQRARWRIEQRPVDVGQPVGLTISLGVAAYPDHADDGATLVARADAALYAAKAAGRNRVVAAPTAATESSHDEPAGAATTQDE